MHLDPSNIENCAWRLMFYLIYLISVDHSEKVRCFSKYFCFCFFAPKVLFCSLFVQLKVLIYVCLLLIRLCVLT